MGLRQRGLTGVGPAMSAGPSLVGPGQASGGGSSAVFPSRPLLLVRRLGAGVGCLLGARGHFRPLVSRRAVVLHQPKGTASHPPGSPVVLGEAPLEQSCSVLRQFHGCGVSAKSGRYSLGDPQRGSSGNPTLGRGETDFSGPAIHSRYLQCSGRRLVQTEPGHRFRVVTEPGGLQGSSEEVVSLYRLVCNQPKQ